MCYILETIKEELPQATILDDGQGDGYVVFEIDDEEFTIAFWSTDYPEKYGFKRGFDLESKDGTIWVVEKEIEDLFKFFK